MIDAIGTTHYSFGKYLSELLNPLTHNDYSLKIPLMQPRELAESFFKSMKMMITCSSHWMLLHYSQKRKPSISSLIASIMKSKFQYHYQNVHLKSLF